jgi:predicted transcriptional regulator
MTKKDMLLRDKEGSVFLYTTVVKEDEVQKNLSERLLNTAYKGAAMKLAMHALGQNKASKEELEALQVWLNQQKVD